MWLFRPMWTLKHQFRNGVPLSVIVSVCVSLAPTGWISAKVDFGDFYYESLSRNLKLVKIRQKYEALCVKT